MIACLGRFVSQTRGGTTRCNYAQWGAVLSHVKCSPGPNSMSYGLKIYRSVRGRLPTSSLNVNPFVLILHGVMPDFLLSYKLQVALTSLIFCFNKSTANGPLGTGHKNVGSIFQRPTLRIAAGRPFPLLQSGPGWPSS